jgi:putative transposase
VTLVRERPRILSIAEACEAVDLPRATYYYAIRKVETRTGGWRSSRRLSDAERAYVLEVLSSERFCNMAPLEVWATLMDDKVFLCSVRTMYRILEENKAVRERRDHLRHPEYVKPELLATAPNMVWSWDITKLKGPAQLSCYHLYVIMDIFSRKTVGWMVAGHESATLASKLIDETCQREGISRDQLTIHADRGPSMRSKTVALLLADMGITKTHSRPYTSNDNPYSESQFRTMKYRPDFPKRFGSIQDARAFCRGFFDWYNNEHHHTGIGLLTPHQLHSGQADEITRQRQDVLSDFYSQHPERFVKGVPVPPKVPDAAWINKPKDKPDVA